MSTIIIIAIGVGGAVVGNRAFALWYAPRMWRKFYAEEDAKDRAVGLEPHFDPKRARRERRA